MDGDFKDHIHKLLKNKNKTMNDFWENINYEEIHKDLKRVVQYLTEL